MHLATYQREVINISGDGYCLLNAIIKGLENDYGIIKCQKEIIDEVLEKLYNHSDQYVNYFHNTKREMLKEAEQYNKKASTVYCGQIVDVIICAAANFLGINLAAFQNIREKAVIINTMCAKKPSEITVFLKYDHDINNPASNHYSAIVLMPDKVLEEVAMANEDVINQEPTPVQSEVPSDNIKVVIIPNTRNQQK